jgi:SAM-dependent methyltransferase
MVVAMNPALVESRNNRPSTGEWIIKGVDPVAATAFLGKYQPWRRELQFEGGPKSSDFKITTPFARAPLSKLRIALPHIPEHVLGGRVLDIGSNLGHHSLYLAQRYGASATGIEFSPSFKHISEELASLMSVDTRFLIADAEEYEEPEAFDLVLHFGTLYHLRNPVRSLEKSIKSMKKGGWMALETVCLKSNDPTLSKWIYSFGGDRTNSWALGTGVIISVADYCGIRNMHVVHQSEQSVGQIKDETYESQLSRCTFVGQKTE